jgi:hypothetical protein
MYKSSRRRIGYRMQSRSLTRSGINMKKSLKSGVNVHTVQNLLDRLATSCTAIHVLH